MIKALTDYRQNSMADKINSTLYAQVIIFNLGYKLLVNETDRLRQVRIDRSEQIWMQLNGLTEIQPQPQITLTPVCLENSSIVSALSPSVIIVSTDDNGQIKKASAEFNLSCGVTAMTCLETSTIAFLTSLSS
jgi:hypothetical protein